MSSVSARFETLTRLATANADAPADAFSERLSSLYGVSQRSNYVFGSPLGPFYHQGRHLHLPRFVYFGPHTHDESLRLAFLAGFDSRDLRATLALAHFVEGLALAPDLGQGLNLSFFPLLDIVGLARGVTGRWLSRADWRHATAPELSILEKDARARAYHGFVRVETDSGGDAIGIRLRNAPDGSVPSGIELISSADFEPWPVRWEADNVDGRPLDGPLTAADDFPLQPFELTIRLPGEWSEEQHRESLSLILKRFILRQRAIQAYSQHL